MILLWVGGGINGKDVLHFEGMSDYMTIADSNSLDGVTASGATGTGLGNYTISYNNGSLNDACRADDLRE